VEVGMMAGAGCEGPRTLLFVSAWEEHTDMRGEARMKKQLRRQSVVVPLIFN